MECPRCGHPQQLAGDECESCGVIFARFEARRAAGRPQARGPGAAASAARPEAGPAEGTAAIGASSNGTRPEADPDRGAPTSRSGSPPAPLVIEDDVAIDRRGWAAFAIGAGLALLTQWLPILQVLVGSFVVLVHELGHALAGWLFGYPSVPAFDFTYGGGVTMHREQVGLLVALVLAGLALVAVWLRASAPALMVIGAVVAGYLLLLVTPGHEIAMIAMGHGGELLFATLFLHRALSGRGCKLEAERPLYAWIGFHIVLHDLGFAWRLATSPVERALYEDAKGGGHWMDFSRLSEEFLGVPLEAVALVFLGLCLLPPVVAVAGNLSKAALLDLLHGVLHPVARRRSERGASGALGSRPPSRA